MKKERRKKMSKEMSYEEIKRQDEGYDNVIKTLEFLLEKIKHEKFMFGLEHSFVVFSESLKRVKK